MHKYLALLEAATSKQELRAILLSIIHTLVAYAKMAKTDTNSSDMSESNRASHVPCKLKAAKVQESNKLTKPLLTPSHYLSPLYSPNFYQQLCQDINIYEKIFNLFRDKIFTIFDHGDIIDSAFLYLGFIAPTHLSCDDRFLSFVQLADKMLAQNPSQEEHIMLVELGAISRILYSPQAQNMSIFSTTRDLSFAALESINPSIDDGLMFFLTHIMLVGIDSPSSGRCAEFMLEAFTIFDVRFDVLYPALSFAFTKAKAPIVRRNICNWQLHILWNIPHLFNNREWLCLYGLWKDGLYAALSRAKMAIDQVGQSLESSMPKTQETKQSQNARMQAEIAIDEALYLQFFLYHMCGNSFSTQEQWALFNTEVSKATTPIYRDFAIHFLDKSENASSIPIKTEPESSMLHNKSDRIIIGFLRDRLVENSPFKVEYSLLKNLLTHKEFNNRFVIKVYCMSLIEKSENNPEVISKLAALGIETIDIGLGFNKAGFYNSHLQKACALRSIIQKDRVAVLISPNNGYGISDFLLATRSAPLQVFWTHGNFVYDICGIDARLTHICDNQAHITHHSFSFYGIPVKMDDVFYNPPVDQTLVAKEQMKYIPKSTSKSNTSLGATLAKEYFLMGVIGRLTKIDSLEYLRIICVLLDKRKEWAFLACGLGNEQEIRRKITTINPNVLDRFYFGGYVDSALYGHLLDFWVDSFPMEQGESRIEYVAKSRGLTLRYYPFCANVLQERLEQQLTAIRDVIEAIIVDSRFASKEKDGRHSRESYIGDVASALDSGLFCDFASYKALFLGFMEQTSAFSAQEYQDKALILMDKTAFKKTNEESKVKKSRQGFSQLLQTQSAIHSMNNAIKARLGVQYFLRFLHEHSLC